MTEQPKKWKHLFICRLSQHSIQVTHPEDMKIKDIDERNEKAYLVEFRNAHYGTNDDREAEALKLNKYHGHDYFYDEENREVVRERDVVEGKIADKLNQIPLKKLKSIAHEKQLREWPTLIKMSKEQMINLFIDNRDLVKEYATI